MGKEAKTNAMRILERAKVAYTAHEYPHEEGVAVDGIHVAQSMGEDPACVYKTLVTQGASRNYFVFVIPVAAELEARAARVRDAVNRRYYNGDGSYAHDEMTSLGGALFHGVAPETERAVIAARLDRIVREHRYIPDFGILGSKAVPRALADAGYVETAYRMFTQPEYPGWIHWLRQGATTLWGN